MMNLAENIVIKKVPINLPSCKYKQFKARKGAGIALSKDGNFVYIYEKKVVTKLKTK